MDGPQMVTQSDCALAINHRKKNNQSPFQKKGQAAPPAAVPTVRPMPVIPAPAGALASSLDRACDCCGGCWSGLPGNLYREIDGQPEPKYWRVHAAPLLRNPPRFTLRVPGEAEVVFDNFRDFFDAVADGHNGAWDIWPLPGDREPRECDRMVDSFWLCDSCWDEAETDGLPKTLDKHESDARRNGALSSPFRQLLTKYRDEGKEFPEGPADAIDDAFIFIVVQESNARNFGDTIQRMLACIQSDALARLLMEIPVGGLQSACWQAAGELLRDVLPTDPAKWKDWQREAVDVFSGRIHPEGDTRK